MSVKTILGLCCFLTAGSSIPIAGETARYMGRDRQTERIAWLKRQIETIKTIRIGSTRAELLVLFTPSGGISAPDKRSYLFQENDLIRVDVRFESRADDRGYIGFNPEDKIIEISAPYLSASDVID